MNRLDLAVELSAAVTILTSIVHDLRDPRLGTVDIHDDIRDAVAHVLQATEEWHTDNE